MVEQPGAEAHVLRREVPGAARRVDVDDAVRIGMGRGLVAVGQRRGGCGGEEAAAAVAVDVAAGEGAREAGGAERYARAEEEEVAKRRRRRSAGMTQPRTIIN